MLITICNEDKRLGRSVDNPYAVVMFRSKTSRSPIVVHRSTLHDAMCFVEESTGVCAHRWVKTVDNDYEIHSFTGTHADRYEDTAQYKPAGNLAEEL